MKKSPSVVALLPMKGHSERVPGKNLRAIGGKPLCLWILENLVSIDSIDRVIINTDSPKIAEVCSISDKVLIHERPKVLCGDMVSMNDIIAYDINKVVADIYLQTHATNPLLKSKTIKSAIDEYMRIDDNYDSVFSVTRLQTRLYDALGKAINHDPNKLIRTQDLPPIYEENSNFYIFTKDSFSKSGKRIGFKPHMFEVDASEAIDIDELIDFKIADILLQDRN